MSALAATQCPLLVVEANPDIGDILSLVLAEEGYQIHHASSLEEALVLVDEHMFQLILADVFLVGPGAPLDILQLLRRRAWPIPVALLTTQKLQAEEIKRQGFAFLLPMPFDLEDLLARIAETLRCPLSPEQQRQLQIAERYCLAASARDWETLLSLCTEDVACYPPADALITRSRKMSGKAAFRDYLERCFGSDEQRSIRELAIHVRPKGLGVRYVYAWVASDGQERRGAGHFHLHFRGEQICQVSLRGNERRFPPFLPTMRAS